MGWPRGDGLGLRVLATCRLRVRDIDFERQVITVRSGKWDKDRTTLLPATCIPTLRRQVSPAEQRLAHHLNNGGCPRDASPRAGSPVSRRGNFAGLERTLPVCIAPWFEA